MVSGACFVEDNGTIRYQAITVKPWGWEVGLMKKRTCLRSGRAKTLTPGSIRRLSRASTCHRVYIMKRSSDMVCAEILFERKQSPSAFISVSRTCLRWVRIHLPFIEGERTMLALVRKRGITCTVTCNDTQSQASGTRSIIKLKARCRETKLENDVALWASCRNTWSLILECPLNARNYRELTSGGSR